MIGLVFMQSRSALQARAALRIKPGSSSASWLQFGAVAAQSTSLQQPTTKRQLSFPSSATPYNSSPVSHTYAAAITAAFKRQWQKKGSEQSKSKPTPSWLANLAVLGVGAAVVAANTEQMPITGRRQFTLGFLHTPSVSRSSSGQLPTVAELHRHEFGTDTCFHVLQEQGLQVMQNTYQMAASGVARLAASNPILQQRLERIPKRIVLQHDVNILCPEAAMGLIIEDQNGAEVSGFGDQLLLGKHHHMRVTQSAGDLLLPQAPEEAV